jgi:hypothetical protein
MGSRQDDDYWNDRYAEASCYEHGRESMYRVGSEWICNDCEEEDEEDE